MTYTFKLAQRLARFRTSMKVGPLLWLFACSADNSSTSEPTAPGGAELAAVVLVPRNVTAETNQTVQFTAFGQSSAGDSMAVSVEYTATGGTVTPDGVFRAPTAGTYKVVGRGKGRGHTKPDTGTVIVIPPAPTLTAIVVTPDTATLAAGGKMTFTATGKVTDGSTTAVGVNWTATGGPIDAGGNYTAGTTGGTYRVIATAASGPLADTATVTITPAPAPAAPTLQAVVLTPDSVLLQAGATQQFAVSGTMSDGSTGAMSVSYSATGGTITSAGLYTAGSTAGTYRLIATASGGKADTSTVTITAPSVASRCTGVVVAAGTSIQAAVDNHSAGTTFCLGAGTFANQTVMPKAGNTFIGARDASGARLTTLDGGLVVSYAFRNCSGCPGRDAVTIRGLKITRYSPSLQEGAVGADWKSSEATSGWVIADNEIFSNRGGAGIRLGHRMRVLGNNIHHNGQIGMVGSGDSILVDGDTLAYNNVGGFSSGFEAGGVKFVKTRWLTVRNTFSHHNDGPGLWTDGDNIYTLYEGNRVEDNAAAGIFHEISEAVVIRNNTVRRNGLKGYNWYYGAGILISASRNAEIYGNTVEENARGIIGIMQNRGSGAYGAHELANMYVHDNIVIMTITAHDAVGHGNVTGIAIDIPDNSYFTSKGNRFVNNVYHLGTAAKYFAWQTGELTEAQWRAVGQDLTGTFIR